MKLLEEAGLPPGVINFVPGDPVAISERRAVAPRSRRRALHRQHGGVQLDVADDRDEHVAVRELSAHRRRDGREGFHRRARVGRSAGARRGDRARRIRVPGTEVLGGEPRLRAALALARAARSGWSAIIEELEDGRRHRLHELHGRGHRPALVHEDLRLPRRREAERDRYSPAASPTGKDGYFIQPDARRDRRIPATGCCARRSSARSSRRTSTTTRSGRRRCASSTRRRRTR